MMVCAGLIGLATATFKVVPHGRATLPGPVDYGRLLVAELVDGAFDGVSGAIRPDWNFANRSFE
jgi:predicted N-acetyltransferase YhbS